MKVFTIVALSLKRLTRADLVGKSVAERANHAGFALRLMSLGGRTRLPLRFPMQMKVFTIVALSPKSVP